MPLPNKFDTFGNAESRSFFNKLLITQKKMPKSSQHRFWADHVKNAESHSFFNKTLITRKKTSKKIKSDLGHPCESMGGLSFHQFLTGQKNTDRISSDTNFRSKAFRDFHIFEIRLTNEEYIKGVRCLVKDFFTLKIQFIRLLLSTSHKNTLFRTLYNLRFLQNLTILLRVLSLAMSFSPRVRPACHGPLT